jgi:hypothetical protein
MDVEDEDVANRLAMEATDRDGTRELLTTIPDPLEAGGVKTSPLWIASTVARKATGRASARRSAPSREEQCPGPDEPTEGIDSDRITQKNLKTP